DVAAEDRAAHTAQRVRVGEKRETDARAHAGRPQPVDHAALPHPWADRVAARATVGGRRIMLLAGFQRAQVFRVDGGSEADVVYGGADDAPGDSLARVEERRR